MHVEKRLCICNQNGNIFLSTAAFEPLQQFTALPMLRGILIGHRSVVFEIFFLTLSFDISKNLQLSIYLL